MPSLNPQSAKHPFVLRLALGLLRALASLELAIFVMAILVAVLVWGTFVEKWYGDTAARFGIYGAWWFTGLGAILGLNIFCALAIRFPWKRQQTGFVVAHVGLLVLLLGCLISRRAGLEATVAMFEGQSTAIAYKDSQQHFELDGQQHFELTVESSNKAQAAHSPTDKAGEADSSSHGEVFWVPFTPGPFHWEEYRRLPWFPWHLATRDQGVIFDRDGIRLEVLDYYCNARMTAVPQVEVEVATPTSTPHGHREAEEGQGPQLLHVQAADGPHAAGRPYGMGTRRKLSGNQRLLFWMTGSPEETAAFRNSKPDGPLGKLGRIILRVGEQNFQFALDDWKPGTRRPLGKTGLDAQFIELDPRFSTVKLEILRSGESPQKMVLSAEFPEMLSQQDYRNRVFGTYWCEAAKKPEDKADTVHAGMLDGGRLRIDLLQGSDQRLYLRTWRAGRVELSGPLATNAAKVNVFEGTPDATSLAINSFAPSEKPELLPMPLDRSKGGQQPRQARLRLTIDDNSEEFWLAGLSQDPLTRFAPPPPNPQRTVAGKDRRVVVTLQPNTYQLGLELRLRKAQRKLDPGTKQPSYYASTVDFTPVAAQDSGSAERKPLQENVLVALNAPVDFTDPATGRSYRLFQTGMQGPYAPEEVQSASTDPVYVTYLTINHDPGRGLEYAGCLLVVAGVFIRYYVKRFARASQGASRAVAAKGSATVLAMALLACSGAARGEDTQRLDWSAWQRVPVLDSGRIMPLDTFARGQVKKICGVINPRIGLAGALSKAETASLLPGDTQQILAVDRLREFTASELLFSWLAETDKWEYIPFLLADDDALRTELLEVPLFGEHGQRLKYVSPRQVAGAKKFQQTLDELNRKEEKSPEPSGRDKKARDLFEAYTLYRQLTFNPAQPADGRGSSTESIIAIARAWIPLEEELMRSPMAQQKDVGDLVARTAESMRKLVAPLMQGGDPNRELKDLEPLVAGIERSSNDLAARVTDLAQRAGQGRGNLPDAQAQLLQARQRTMAVRTAEVARLATLAHWSLYDSGESIRLVPTLEPSALEADRYRSDIQPWISLQTLQGGSAELLHRYPQDLVEKVRAALREATTAYRDRGAPNRSDSFAAAMERFTAAVRQLGEAIEPQRQKLPIRERDESILAATAYPPAGATGAEVLYNRLDPFFWSWALSLAAVVCLAVSLVVLRKPAFWLGIGVLLTAHTFILIGFGLRTYITHWAPVTNMFETIVFVALCVALLTVWLTLLPLLRSGGSAGWRSTALPGTWEATELDEEQLALCPRGAWQAANWSLLLPRVALMGYVVYLTGILQSQRPGEGYRMITLLPRVDIGSSIPTLSALLIWAAGLFVVAVMVWYLPRLIPAALVTLPAAAYALARQGVAHRFDQVYQRRTVALVGAAVAMGAAVLAYYAPFPKDIRPLMAVLRSNVWLAIHVLTITAGYGAAALAWGLGNIALGYYLFGRYRTTAESPATDDDEEGADEGQPRPSTDRPRPPQACATLARLNYKIIQVAVLLLLVGTILGGMWADVSWGRFWGWDPKEVWALISLLIYMIILHARKAGWSGDFSLTLGSVLGFTAIIWAWYGVNFLMPGGKHSYGEGGGGQWAVVGAIVLNWFFLAQAAVRAWAENRRRGAGETPPQRRPE